MPPLEFDTEKAGSQDTADTRESLGAGAFGLEPRQQVWAQLPPSAEIFVTFVQVFEWNVFLK